MSFISKELEGLQVVLDKLVYHYQPENTPEGQPHVFIYFITIKNLSQRAVTLLARKWIIRSETGDTDVIEGDKIVGKTPKLQPGESFSYNSYHIGGCSCTAWGAYHGVDEQGQAIFCRIPEITMNIPEQPSHLPIDPNYG